MHRRECQHTSSSSAPTAPDLGLPLAGWSRQASPSGQATSCCHTPLPPAQSLCPWHAGKHERRPMHPRLPGASHESSRLLSAIPTGRLFLQVRQHDRHPLRVRGGVPQHHRAAAGWQQLPPGAAGAAGLRHRHQRRQRSEGGALPSCAVIAWLALIGGPSCCSPAPPLRAFDARRGWSSSRRRASCRTRCWRWQRWASAAPPQRPWLASAPWQTWRSARPQRSWWRVRA